MPMEKNKPTRSFFLRGLVALLPAMLTTFAFVFIIQFTTRYVTGPINSAIYWSLEGNAAGWTILGALDVDPEGDEASQKEASVGLVLLHGHDRRGSESRDGMPRG